MTLLQPYEGIRGTDRDDFLLSLDQSAEAHRKAIFQFAQITWRACLTADPAPITRALYERMTAPRPGDLAFMTMIHDPQPWWHGLGILLADRREWAETNDEWNRYIAQPDADRERMPEPHAMYLQYGPASGDIARWENASVLAIPWDAHDELDGRASAIADEKFGRV